MSAPKLNPINQRNGILQIVHDFEFVALNLGTGYTEIRDMNEEEKYLYLCSRVKKLKDRGYGGVVLNSDLKNYLEHSEDIAQILKVAEYAKSLGLAVWIYDEQYYPSGSAGGLTLKGHPELETLGLCEVSKTQKTDGRTSIRVASPYGHSELKYAVAIPVKDGICDYDNVCDVSADKDLSGGLSTYLPEGEWCVRCYFYRAIFDHSPYAQALRASRRTVNIFDSRTMDRFFDITYESGYMKYCNGKLGDTVDTVFTDEPHYPACAPHTVKCACRSKYPSHSVKDEEDIDVVIYPYIIWTEDMPERYYKEYGESLIPLLPHLFVKTEKSREVRTAFYTLTSKMANEGFVVSYRERLAKCGVKLSGHYYFEESPDFHPIYFGDIIEHLSNFSIPGCDNLMSEPDALRYCIACKFASSASHLAGKNRTMIEASNMRDADQNITLSRLKGAISIMLAHGVNCITSYYGEDILPSDEMAKFADYVSKLSSIFENGSYKTDTLLYYPYENFCSVTEPLSRDNIHTKFHDTLGLMDSARELIGAQVGFDIINKKFLLESEICHGSLLLKNGERVKRIVLPRIEWADKELSSFLNKAKENGIAIFSPDGKAVEGLEFIPQRLDVAAFPKGEIYLTEKNPYILAMQKSYPDYDVFMLVNSKEEEVMSTVKIADNGSKYATVNIESYSTEAANHTVENGYASFDLTFAPLEAKLIMRYNDKIRIS